MTDSHGNLVFQPTATRWVGTGRVVYDNKANPVKAYEPFFDSSPGYDDETDLVDWGVTAITGYDPLSRVIRVDNPDGTYRTTEYRRLGHVGLRRERHRPGQRLVRGPAGAAPASARRPTPPRRRRPTPPRPPLSDLDTLGRVFHTVADNGAAGQYATILGLDIQGNTRTVTDAARPGDPDRGLQPGRRRHPPRQRRLGRALAGHRRRRPSRSRPGTAAAPPGAVRDYDTLRRPVTVHVTRAAAPSALAEQVTYGEGLADAQARNLRGAVYQHRDEAGVATNHQRDFDGNVLSASRQFLADYSGDVDWSQAPPAGRRNLHHGLTTYDALNRPVTITTPDGSVTSPAYNERSLLAQVSVSPGGGGTPTSSGDQRHLRRQGPAAGHQLRQRRHDQLRL